MGSWGFAWRYHSPNCRSIFDFECWVRFAPFCFAIKKYLRSNCHSSSFQWTMRTFGFIFLVMLGISNLVSPCSYASAEIYSVNNSYYDDVFLPATYKVVSSISTLSNMRPTQSTACLVSWVISGFTLVRNHPHSFLSRLMFF